jgi:hypothetical protein
LVFRSYLNNRNYRMTKSLVIGFENANNSWHHCLRAWTCLAQIKTSQGGHFELPHQKRVF